MEELRKKIKEERKLKEAQDLEIKAGRLDPQKLLNIRRINWMYEHGPQGTTECKSEERENEREDVLMGKKAPSLETLNDVNVKASPSLVGIETKMLEDPLLEIQRKRMKFMRERRICMEHTMVATGSTQRCARLRRTEHRQAVREERRQRREAGRMKPTLSQNSYDGENSRLRARPPLPPSVNMAVTTQNLSSQL